MIRLFASLFLLNLICSLSCKKKVEEAQQSFCLPDSSKFNVNVNVYFKHDQGRIVEARTIRDNQPYHLITFGYVNGKTTEALYYFLPISAFSRKYMYSYNSAGLLSGVTHYKFNGTTSVFEKVKSAAYSYQNSVLSEVKLLSFNPGDSIQPSGSDTVIYKNRNGNIDTAYNRIWDISANFYSFESSETENVLANNYFFLTDPTLISEEFLFDPLKIPFLLNTKAVTTVFKHFTVQYKETYLSSRVGINIFSKPEFLSWGPYKIDYYYGCK